jgi:hypothetical protein
MTAVQPPRHRAPAGAQGFGREPHPSGPITVTPRRSRLVATTAAAVPAPADEPLTMPIPRAALDAARIAPPVQPPMTGGVPPAPAGAPAPQRRRRWPWIVLAVFVVLVIAGALGPKTPPAPVQPTAPAPVASPSAPAVAPAAVTLPADVVGRNAQIVDGQLRGLGLTNITYASQDPEDTVVVLLANWTVTGIEPGAGTSVAAGDAVVVSVTKGASGSTGASAPASSAPATSGPATSFGDGTHVVGEDIAPGTYRTSGPASGGLGMCYWSRLSNTSGEFDAIIANGVPTGPATVTIRSGDEAFETTGCSTWTKTN